MKKIKFSYPESVGCTQYHSREGYRSGCQSCRTYDHERRTSFLEKAYTKTYEILKEKWADHLKSAEELFKNHQSPKRKDIIESALNSITEKECPWSNAAGLKIWNSVLIDFARFKEPYFVPVIRVKEKKEKGKRQKYKTQILW